MKSMINRSKCPKVPLCGDETKLIEVLLKPRADEDTGSHSASSLTPAVKRGESAGKKMTPSVVNKRNCILL